MRVNSRNKNKKININSLFEKLKTLKLEKHSLNSGLVKRKPRKIFPEKLLVGFFMMVASPGRNSLRNWAMKISFQIGEKVSKQGLWKRTDQNFIEFLKAVLEEAINGSIYSRVTNTSKIKPGKINNILLQDSTHLKLHRNLEEDYPGYENQFKDTKKAGIKIHSIYNISKEKFDDFEISSFRKNDQKASPDILRAAGKGDLILRDLGYFAIETLREITARDIYYISRYHRGVSILDKETQTKINLVKLVKKQSFLDMEVLLGAEHKLPCRIVAIPMTNQAAAQKRRKAKQSRDRRLNPDKDAIFLMGWMIYITNLGREDFSGNDIFNYYKLRWRIEVLFKAWKSCFSITDIEEISNKIMVDCFIYLMLLFITLFQSGFSKLRNNDKSPHDYGQHLSILKYAEFLHSNLIFIVHLTLKKVTPDLLYEFIEYYCKYEKRNKRYNFYQSLNSLS